MKIKLDQELQNQFGKPFKAAGLPAMTLRDIIVDCILATERNPNTGQLMPEEEKPKLEKWEIFKKLRNQRKEIDLKAEEITLIKKCIIKFQPQLIMGQTLEMIEGKYEPMEPLKDEEMSVGELNLERIELENRLSELVKIIEKREKNEGI